MNTSELKVLVLGANGQIARLVTERLRNRAEVSLFLRNPKRLGREPPGRLIEGDVLDAKALRAAVEGHDVVYANLSGQLEAQATNIVGAMTATGVKRLIFISSMGIYDEVPGERAGPILDPYRRSAALIEASSLDYTIVRPAWFTDDDEIRYALTQKGEPFRGSVVSKKSVAELVVKLVLDPTLAVRGSLGIAKP